MATQADGSKAEKGAPELVPAEKVRDWLGDYLGRVEFGRESFVITRHGKPSAKLVPINADAG